MTTNLIEYRPLTPANWEDLVELFEGVGNPGYCWCTFWRLSSKEYGQSSRRQRKDVLNDCVQRGMPTGILGYQNGEVIGWCSIAPRHTYKRLNRSRMIPFIDNRITWSVVCFYLNRSVQGLGLSFDLLQAAVNYAAGQGAEVVEAYPVEPQYDEQGNWQPAKSYRFMGYRSTFERAGFQDATPEDAKRVIMRLEL